MPFIYYVVTGLAVLMMGWEAYTIFTRNRKIEIKGRDDLFLFVLLLGFFMILLAPKEGAEIATAVASVSVLAAMLFQLTVKRGITKQGVQKLFFCIPWDLIQEVKIEMIEMSRSKAYFVTAERTYSLIFLNRDIRKVIYEFQKRRIKVYTDGKLKLQ